MNFTNRTNAAQQALQNQWKLENSNCIKLQLIQTLEVIGPFSSSQNIPGYQINQQSFKRMIDSTSQATEMKQQMLRRGNQTQGEHLSSK